MSALLHGIELNGECKPQYMRFGILRLLYGLHKSLLITGKPDPRLQEWRESIGSNDFKYRLNHFRQCFEKFDRAAGHVTRCKDAKDVVIGRYRERIKHYQAGETREEIRELQPSDPEWLEMMEMMEFDKELPLFLDAMLFYLRIQADSYAQLMQYFYEPVKARVVPDNFARQIDGEKAKKLGKLDAGYALILQANRKWFDDLTLDGGGLRDVVTHESGMMGVQWVKPQGAPIEARTSLYTRNGLVEEDLFHALKEITAGWFAFLDEAYRHFVPRLNSAGMLRALSADDLERSRFFEANELRGFWVYPVVNPTL